MWLHRQIALLWVDDKPWSFTLNPSISTAIRARGVGEFQTQSEQNAQADSR